MSKRDQVTFVVDELSVDGSKPLPSPADLAAMDKAEILALRSRAMDRKRDLKIMLSNASHDKRVADVKLPWTQLTAIRRSASWYARLAEITQLALSLRNAQAKKARVAAHGELKQTDSERFVEASKRFLSKELYLSIWEEVNRGINDR